MSLLCYEKDTEKSEGIQLKRFKLFNIFSPIVPKKANKILLILIIKNLFCKSKFFLQNFIAFIVFCKKRKISIQFVIKSVFKFVP